MLSQLIDLIINICVVVFIIFILNLILTKKIHEHKVSEPFLDTQFPNLQHYPKAINDVNNNEYNELLNYIFSDSEVFANDAPINDRHGPSTQHNNNEMIKDAIIQNKINNEPHSDMPYDNQVSYSSLMNNNLLNNENNEIKAQIPQYINTKKGHSELLNSDNNNSNEISGFDIYDTQLNSQFESLL
jgi:hypothetical protein